MERLRLSAGHQSASNWLGGGFFLSAITFIFFLPPFCSFYHTVLFFSWLVCFSFVSHYTSISIKTLFSVRLFFFHPCLVHNILSFQSYHFFLVVFSTHLPWHSCLHVIVFFCSSPLFSFSAGSSPAFLAQGAAEWLQPHGAAGGQRLPGSHCAVLLYFNTGHGCGMHCKNASWAQLPICKEMLVFEGQLLMIITLMPFKCNSEIHCLQSLFLLFVKKRCFTSLY